MPYFRCGKNKNGERFSNILCSEGLKSILGWSYVSFHFIILILFKFFVEPGNVWNSHIGVESHDSVYHLPPHFTASPRIVRGKIRNMKRGSFSVVCVRHGLVSSLFYPGG